MGRSGRGVTGCSPGCEEPFALLEAEPGPAVLQPVVPSGVASGHPPERRWRQPGRLIATPMPRRHGPPAGRVRPVVSRREEANHGLPSQVTRDTLMIPCPSDEELTGLLAGALSAAEGDTLARHVEGCASCQSRLTRLTATPTSRRGGAQSLHPGGPGPKT